MSQRRWEEEEDSFHPPVRLFFCPFLRFIFPLQRRKKEDGCCSDDSHAHANKKRRKLVVLAENRLSEMILGPKLGEKDMTRLWVCFCPL